MGSDERGPSFTARVVATYRARHQVIGDVPIFRDPFAGPLLGDDIVPLDDDNRYVVRARHFIVARARAADDLLRAAVARGVRRCVVLGAGLDTTALRHPELDVLEIDLAETQAWKRERLAVAGLAVPPRCRLVPVDFTRDDLAAVLAREGVGPAAPAFFIWLGVSYYLDAAAVRATLAAVAATGPDAAVVFDAYRALEELADDARDRLLAIGARVRDVGEPFIGLFGRAELAALAASAGLPAVDIESDADLLARYGADPGLALGFADLVHARAR